MTDYGWKSPSGIRNGNQDMIQRRGRRGFRRGRREAILGVPPRNPLRPLRLMTSLMTLNLIFTTLSFSQAPTRTNSLLESGQATKLAQLPKAPSEIRVVSYNIRWRTGTQLEEIARWLKGKNEATPLIIALQEVDRARQRTGKVNNARVLADRVGLYYAWAAPPGAKSDKSAEEETGVELLSSFPLKEVTRLVLPYTGPGGRSRVALGATMTAGDKDIRVYSVHSETRIAVSQKIGQLQAVLDDLGHFSPKTRAIVMGDFNTWELPAVESTRKLFTAAGFTTPFADEETTFMRNVLLLDIKLKLDWIWVRGLPVQSYGIDRTITVSDHFPLWTVVRITN
jgi:endonuclease/exonuclease/phosphatase family metal-dependent hydrolase